MGGTVLELAGYSMPDGLQPVVLFPGVSWPVPRMAWYAFLVMVASASQALVGVLSVAAIIWGKCRPNH